MIFDGTITYCHTRGSRDYQGILRCSFRHQMEIVLLKWQIANNFIDRSETKQKIKLIYVQVCFLLRP